MRIKIPEFAMVVLVGVSGSGKTTFAKKFFEPSEILSGDYSDAASKRLVLGLLTVIDEPNLQKELRAEAINLAKEQNCLAVAVVFDMSEKVCFERNETRNNHRFNRDEIQQQSMLLRSYVNSLKKEGFRHVYVLKNESEVNSVEVARVPLSNNKKDKKGPFDIIGDVHGCYDELCALLKKLEYTVDEENGFAIPPEGRTVIFLGDICYRGPHTAKVLRLVMNMVSRNTAYCVCGNNEARLLRELRNRNLATTGEVKKTLGQLIVQGEDFIVEAKSFLTDLISHYIFDGGRLVVAHAGIIEKYQGRSGERVRKFCLYGDTSGGTDEYGLTVRLPWANDYSGEATVVYGHTPMLEPKITNNTYCIDTGCVLGGKLTALRYPEKEIVQVNALKKYSTSVKAFSN